MLSIVRGAWNPDMSFVQQWMARSVMVTKTDLPDSGDPAFRVLNKMGMPVGDGAVICRAGQALPISETVWSLPARCL
jgi:hypothetical protein